jgi:uncharacterized protein YkwD
MIVLTNIFREMESLQPLISNPTLDEIALKHAKRMSRLNWLSDYKLKECIDKLKNLPGSIFEEVVWNISLGSNFEIASKRIINEPDTRSKILGDYTEFGHGEFQSKTGMKYHCMLYGRLKK